MPFSLRDSPAPSTSTVVDYDTSDGVHDDSSGSGTLDRVQNNSSDGEDGTDTP
jgi:hypothetical protein